MRCLFRVVFVCGDVHSFRVAPRTFAAKKKKENAWGHEQNVTVATKGSIGSLGGWM